MADSDTSSDDSFAEVTEDRETHIARMQYLAKASGHEQLINHLNVPGLHVGRKRSSNSDSRRHRHPNFGICFDIDGVLARGTVPIPAAQEGFKKLLDLQNKIKFPVAFVTNALNTNQDKANQLSSWFGVQVSKEQMIQSPGPLEVFEAFHNKRCLIVGQGKMVEIAQELGFKDLCTVEDVARARPLLDVANHENRRKLDGVTLEHPPFAPIEVILLMGEPKHWESSLQILVDILVTNGQPDREPETTPVKQLPVIACNMDLRFMERCHMPRFGHGAFLVCLEALYEKITGKPLQYASLMGKPSEITFRFTEHVLTREAIKLGYKEPIKTMYFIGDNPESDIVGSNLYQRYIDRMKHRRRRISSASLQTHFHLNPEYARQDPELPPSRNMPPQTKFTHQTIDTVESILVCTGVYDCTEDEELKGATDGCKNTPAHGHRDFPRIPELHIPALVCKDANEAIDYILKNEQITK